MIIIISAIIIFIVAFFLAKRIIIKKLQVQYERSLLNGDRKEDVRLGKIYYLSLDEATRKAKQIIDIDAKISDDFNAFNDKYFCIL